MGRAGAFGSEVAAGGPGWCCGHVRVWGATPCAVRGPRRRGPSWQDSCYGFASGNASRGARGRSSSSRPRSPCECWRARRRRALRSRGVADGALRLPPRRIGEDAGVDFMHEGPSFDARLEHIMPQVASMGAAVAVADFDRDGWQDFDSRPAPKAASTACTGTRATGRSRTSRVTWARLMSPGAPRASRWGRSGPTSTTTASTICSFTVTAVRSSFTTTGPIVSRGRRAAGLPEWLNANSAIWLDYDRDGCLDLVVAGYWPDNVDLWKLETTKIMPESFEYATNGGRKYLLHNRGDGTFEDKADALGIKSRRWTLALIAADFLAPAIPICSCRMTTVCPSCLPIAAARASWTWRGCGRGRHRRAG